jgi:hypothetical protein
MSDLKKMQLEVAKDLAEIAQTGLDTSNITNTVHISNDPTRPSYGTAGSGNDFVFSEVGGAVNGGGGNDILMSGNSGVYAFHGGTGNDTVAYINATQGATIALDANVLGYPTVTNSGAAAGDTYDSIENVVGTNFSDSIYGDAHDNKLYGGAGNDSINGGGGNDVINGGDGNDRIWGQLDGTDVVSGGDHKDIYGNDVWGKDTFNFDIVGGHNFNLTITDFHPQIWTGSTAPTVSQAVADPIHDVLELWFEPSTGVTTDAQADAAFVLTNGNPYQFVGHDIVLTVHTPYVDGSITLKGAADLVDSTHTFTVYDFAVHAV